MSPPGPRILMTTDAVGGVWTYATTLARALCALGFEITLVTLGPKPRAEQIAALADIRGLSLEVTDLALEWMDPEGGDIPRARAQLAEIAARINPDLVHLNGFREALYQFDAPVILAAHSCVGSWWEACRGKAPMELKWRTYLHNVAAALDRADAWIAPTHYYRASIERLYRPRREGEVIWNGIAPLEPPARKQNVILAAGRLWDEAKNLSTLVRIAPSLPWPVHTAGATRSDDGSAVAQLDGVTQLGALPHGRLLNEMRRSAIFVAPALYEPFGLGVLEAASCGCGLVLSDIGSFRELWQDAALFADPRDEDALAEAVTTLCRDDLLRARLQRKALKRARRYSLQAMVNDYRWLYDRLATRSRPQPTREPIFAEVGQ